MSLAVLARLFLLSTALLLGQAEPNVLKRASFTDGPKATTLPEVPIELPMLRWGHSPAVRVSVNGQGAFFHFAIDTGGQGVARADTALVEELGLEVIGTVRAADSSGSGTRELDLVAIDSISFGGATFTGIEAATRDYNARPDVAERIDGILGTHLFQDCLLTLDYPGERVIVGEGSLPEPDGETVLSLSPKSAVPAIELEIGGETLLTHIDSGSAGGLMLPARFAATLDLKSPPVEVGRARTVSGEYIIREAPLAGSIRIGKYELRQPRVTFIDGFETANIGSRLLEHFAVTVDLRHSRVRFGRAEAGPIESQPRYRIGVMFAPDPAGVRVADLVAGGAGEAAGLQKGDLLVALNGTPVAELGPQRLRALFSSPRSIEVTVERDGERRTLTLTPQSEAG